MKYFFKILVSLNLLFIALSSPVVVAETKVLMETSEGNVYLSLDELKAPITVENFVSYAKDGFYDGTIFHRVIPGFMIQGGGFDKDMSQKPTKKTIINEGKNGLKNVRGSIAMARRGDPNSATSQFFINHRDNYNLDANGSSAGYAVFGKVSEGLEILDKIAGKATNTQKGHQNVPVKPIVINKVTIMESAKK